MNQDTITNAYTNLSHSRQALYVAVDHLADSKNALETATAKATAGGEIIGKNAEERAANARLLLAQYYADLANDENAERTARLVYDLAQYEVERVKLIVRLTTSNGAE